MEAGGRKRSQAIYEVAALPRSNTSYVSRHTLSPRATLLEKGFDRPHEPRPAIAKRLGTVLAATIVPRYEALYRRICAG